MKSSLSSRARGWRGRRDFDSQVTCHPHEVHARVVILTETFPLPTHASEPRPPRPPLGSTRLRFLCVRPVSAESPVVDMPVHGVHAGAARVWRERKMRSFWRHEQMAIQMVRCNTIRTAFCGTRGLPPELEEWHEMYHTFFSPR